MGDIIMGIMAQAYPGLCSCCDGGAVSCIIGKYCCGPCSYGQAMAKAEVGNCFLCCLFGQCCLPCNAAKVAKKYDMQGPGFVMSVITCCLCPACTMWQQINAVQAGENGKFGCFGSSKPN